MSFLEFPNELFYIVAEDFTPTDLNSFCKINRRLNTVLAPLLHECMIQHKHELLLWAAGRGRERMVRLLLREGADINFWTDSSALYTAVKHGHEEIVKILLENGAEIHNQRADSQAQRSALHEAACQYGRESIAKLLIQKGADINALSGCGMAPLHQAVVHGNEPMVRLLVKKGCDVNIRRRFVIKNQVTPLHYAARLENDEIMRILFDAGASINALDIRQRTPLHVAAVSGTESVAGLLLERGADINAADWEGMTPLLVAAERSRTPMVRWLLNRGASFTAVDKKGSTVLHIAAESHRCNGDVSTVGLLLGKGIDIDVKDSHGKTPLNRAASSGIDEMVSELLRHGAQIEACNGTGVRPLHFAAKSLRACRLSFPTVQVLLDNGAEVNALDRDGRTALHWAVINGQSRDVDLGRDPVIKMLLERGADPNIQDTRYARTALHWATYCDQNWEDLRNLLVGFCADPSIRDSNGQTADELQKLCS